MTYLHDERVSPFSVFGLVRQQGRLTDAAEWELRTPENISDCQLAHSHQSIISGYHITDFE
jgi:hypothetical protein